MKWYRNGTRLWLSEGEIEDTALQELTKAGLLPSMENPVTELELFVERHLGADLDQHADLDPSLLLPDAFVDHADDIRRDRVAGARPNDQR